MITDGEGNICPFGSSFEINYGVEQGFFIGKMPLSWRSRVLFPSTVRSVLEEKRSVIQVQTTNFGRRLIVVANPVFDESGKISRVICLAKDMSDHEQLLSRLNETEKLLDVYRDQPNRNSQLEYEEDDFIAKSEAMLKVLANSRRVAKVDATIKRMGKRRRQKHPRQLYPQTQPPEKPWVYHR